MNGSKRFFESTGHPAASMALTGAAKISPEPVAARPLVLERIA